MSAVIERVGAVTDDLVDAFARLIPQLSSSNPPPGRNQLQAIVSSAIDEARARGAITVELTSRPSREAANRLYKRIGFVQRETNVYRYTL
ncbi:MAG: GNAT family N-acetyltransferase [Actinobacteria bacterium]|nr:GNAT family N-acetyltransferase [Actinomycetota bacterium]